MLYSHGDDLFQVSEILRNILKQNFEHKLNLI